MRYSENISGISSTQTLIYVYYTYIIPVLKSLYGYFKIILLNKLFAPKNVYLYRHLDRATGLQYVIISHSKFYNICSIGINTCILYTELAY